MESQKVNLTSSNQLCQILTQNCPISNQIQTYQILQRNCKDKKESNQDQSIQFQNKHLRLTQLKQTSLDNKNSDHNQNQIKQNIETSDPLIGSTNNQQLKKNILVVQKDLTIVEIQALNEKQSVEIKKQKVQDKTSQKQQSFSISKEINQQNEKKDVNKIQLIQRLSFDNNKFEINKQQPSSTSQNIFKNIKLNLKKPENIDSNQRKKLDQNISNLELLLKIENKKQQLFKSYSEHSNLFSFFKNTTTNDFNDLNKDVKDQKNTNPFLKPDLIKDEQNALQSNLTHKQTKQTSEDKDESQLSEQGQQQLSNNSQTDFSKSTGRYNYNNFSEILTKVQGNHYRRNNSDEVVRNISISIEKLVQQYNLIIRSTQTKTIRYQGLIISKSKISLMNQNQRNIKIQNLISRAQGAQKIQSDYFRIQFKDPISSKKFIDIFKSLKFN